MQNQLANHHFNLDINSVLNFMGYAEPERARPKICLIAEAEMARANDFADSWGVALQVPLCGIRDEEILLKQGDGQVALHSTQLPKILRKSDAVSIMLVTAGRKVTDESRRLMAAGKMTQALAVSAVGSAMVVDLMKELTRQVFAQAQKRNYGTTIRVGPGYTGWHLNDQATLFSFFDQNTAIDQHSIPITLNHGVMMEPEKSLLGMLGLTPGGKEAPEIEPCRICDLKGCDMRKAPFRGFDGQL